MKKYNIVYLKILKGSMKFLKKLKKKQIEYD